MILKRNFKKTLKNVSFLILVLETCLIFGQGHVVVIDPGHGGKDTGAIGVDGIKEKDVVLNIAKEILTLNKTLFDKGPAIYLTRYKDTLVSLTDRSQLARSLKPDVYVSLHCNSSKAFAIGMEVYVHNLDTSNTKASIALGLSLLGESYVELGLKKRGVKFANFQVLRNTSLYPSVLVELGFLTNADEMAYFSEPKNIVAMALAILMGIINYLNTTL